ncbi:MAG TPA: hypothetical protein VGT40_03805 [Methylomirabilota bacterium]|jgi:putative transposon-encoded protein|nr:hypothetical protein [Methylomirabilota bacterium]
MTVGAALFSLFVIGVATAPVHAQATGQPTAEKFILSGVVVFDGGSGLAWLYEPSLTGDRVIAVRLGESIGPYRLAKIFEDRVELEGPSGKVLVPVYYAGANPAAGVGAARQDGAGRGAPTPVAARSEADLLKDLRERAEAARRQAEQQRAVTPEPAPGVNPFANNPSVNYIPVGDPRRRQGLGGLGEK